MPERGAGTTRPLSVVTGATSGFGLAVARHLAGRGHDLVLVARDRDRGAAALHDVESLGPAGGHVVLHADLSSIEDVQRLAVEIAQLDRPIALLVNNAGAVFGFRRQTSVDGIEMTFALNHLAYFELTRGLIEPLLAARAHVVNVASDAYTAGRGFDFDDFEAGQRWQPMRRYGRSKLANILFTHELDRRYGTQGLSSIAWSPNGLTATRFGYGIGRLAPLFMKLTHPFAATTEDAVQPLLDLLDGDFQHAGALVIGTDLHEVSEVDDTSARRLWELSERLVEGASG